MNCEITLFKLNDFKLQNNQIKEGINNIAEQIVLKVFDKSDYFEFYKNKK